jgi:hypothetical protein
MPKYARERDETVMKTGWQRYRQRCSGLVPQHVWPDQHVDGMTIKEKPVSVPDFWATVAKAVVVDPTKTNRSNVGRLIRIADAGSKPIRGVLARIACVGFATAGRAGGCDSRVLARQRVRAGNVAGTGGGDSALS